MVDAIDRHLVEMLRSAPGSDVKQLRRMVAERLPGQDVTRKDVNSRLYQGLHRGAYRRSEDARPHWYLASGQTDGSAVEAARPLVGRTLEELARSFGLEVSTGKLAFRKVGEGVAEASGSGTEPSTLRVIRVSASVRPVEDVQVGTVRFGDLVATPFERSPTARALERIRFVVFADATPREDAVLLADFRWEPSSSQQAMMAADYEAARAAIGRSDVGVLPRGRQVRFLRYGTKAIDRHDVDELPDGSHATRRGFYLVKRALEPVLGPLVGRVEREAVDAGVPRSEPVGAYESLLLGVLQEQLDGG